MNNEFPGGIATAVLTPMHPNLTVDHERLVAHCRWLLERGNEGLVLLGTTGEANSLSVVERMNLVDAVIQAGISPHRIMVGTGCCAFPDTVELTRHALAHRVGGVLMLPPFYYKNPSDDGLFASYANVIERVGHDTMHLYLYHFPQLSGIPLTHSLIERLLKQYPAQVAGIKDSSRDWENARYMIENFPDFRVFAGTEQFLLDILRAGGAGIISATGNVTSSLAAQVFAERENPGVDVLQSHLTKIRLALQAYPAVPALKWLIGEQNEDAAGWKAVRPPLRPLTSKIGEELSKQIRNLNVETASIWGSTLFA